MRIDVHAHLRAPEVLALFARLGWHQEFDPKGLKHTIARTGLEPEHPEGFAARMAERVGWLDAAGVDLQILGPGANNPYFADAARAVEAAAFQNDWYLRVCRDYPRFGLFASLPLPHLDPALAVIGVLGSDPAVMGFALGCSVAGVPIDDDRFDPLWAELNRRRAVVYFHPGAGNAGVPGSHEFHIAPDFGSPAEVAVCLARLIVRGHTRRFPDVKILVATLGGLVPFLANRFDRGYLQQHPDDYHAMGGVLRQFRHFWYDASVIEEPLALLAAKQVFGLERVVLGSDTGRVSVRPQEGVEYITASDWLSPSEKTAIVDDNALKLFQDHPRIGGRR